MMRMPEREGLNAHLPTFGVYNPADGTLIVEISDQGEEEAGAALDLAWSACAEWRATSPDRRGNLLRLWADKLAEQSEALALLISLEQGKPLRESRAELAHGIAHLHWFAEEARRVHGEMVPDQGDGRQRLVVREPVGVVAAITPWNFPFAMPIRKIAPALAAGCSIIVKPAPETPLTAIAIARCACEAGLPEGLVNVVTASRERSAAVARVWLGDARVRKLSFTGSTAVGMELARLAAADLKRLSLELGGNAAFIIFEDADLDRAIDCLMAAKFRNAGQTCISPNRILVHEAVHSAVLEKLSAAIAGLRVGPSSDPLNTVGPLINELAVAKVARHLRDAEQRGAAILVGGRVTGNFFEPTVVTGVTQDMLLTQEETFGPVAAILKFGSEGEAIHIANATPYGLASYFFTSDVDRIWRVSGALKVGMIGVNEGVISNEKAPFGGVKHSGFGREGSRHGIEEYQDLKYLCIGPAHTATF